MMIQSVWKNLTGLQKVLILAEHLWCDFTCRPWAKSSSPNTNDLYIHYMDKSTGTPPSLEEKNLLPNCGNKEIHVLKDCISTSEFCNVWKTPVCVCVRVRKRLQIIQSQFTIAVTVFNDFSMLKAGENMPVKEQVKAVQFVNTCHTHMNNCTIIWAFMRHTVSIVLLGPSCSLVRFYSRRIHQEENTESEGRKICYSGCFCWDAIVSKTNYSFFWLLWDISCNLRRSN